MKSEKVFKPKELQELPVINIEINDGEKTFNVKGYDMTDHPETIEK